MPGCAKLLLLGVLLLNAADGVLGKAFEITEVDREHWSFRPIQRPVPPKVDGSKHRVENPIDEFIAARLDEAGLMMAPPASREKLIRRVSFDLIGLPPTPAEIEFFVKDQDPNAYENLLDRLLQSLHYGERWGRHWLDLARYAETDGYELDAVRPHSWRYRDYVVRSFNEDKPYDRFVREQLAGDELWPGDPEALTATAFNLLGPDMVDSSDQVQRRFNTLNDMTDTAALTFLGLTMGCARCHDHKFEPLSQRDYFRLQAFFNPAKFQREKPIPTQAQREAHERAMAAYNAHPKLRELAALEAPVREQIYERKLAALSPEAQVAHRTPAAKRTSEESNLVLETLKHLEISEQDLTKELSSELKKKRKALQEEIRKVPKPEPLPKTMALEKGGAAKTFLLHRGDYTQPREEVAPGLPEVLSRNACGGDARTALADWIASPSNPLTGRVMVNRIWQHHFGRGLVATPSDFGTRGEKPSHPELLDWLASEFIRTGWSIKRMHKLMLLSATYRQSSDLQDETRLDRALRHDPENRLYWRMNRLRLEGEVIRDALLAISGRLDRRLGGPGVFPAIPKELFAGAAGWKSSEREVDHCRRSIYIFARRNLRFPFLEVFDAPDSNLSCAMRERSTTAPQSLTLLNSDEVLAAARLTAERIESSAKSADDRIKLGFRMVLGRTPSSPEAAIAREFLASSPLHEFCRGLFNLNGFLYVD